MSFDLLKLLILQMSSMACHVGGELPAYLINSFLVSIRFARLPVGDTEGQRTIWFSVGHKLFDFSWQLGLISLNTIEWKRDNRIEDRTEGWCPTSVLSPASQETSCNPPQLWNHVVKFK